MSSDKKGTPLLRGCLKSPDSRQILSSMCSLQLPESWDEAMHIRSEKDEEPLPRSVNLALAGLFKHPLNGGFRADVVST